MKLKDLILFSINNLKQQKIRTLLTIIGIIIGICSVTFLVSISFGVQNYINEIFSKMGKNTLTILPMKQFGIPPEKYFDDKIIKRIISLDCVRYYIYGFYTGGMVEYNGEKKFLPIFYTSTEYFKNYYEMSGYSLLKGDYLKKNSKKEAIVGYSAADKIFNRKIDIGDRIEINGTKFRVVGILDQVGDQQDDDTVIVPLKYAPKKDHYNFIMVYLKESVDKNEAKKEIENLMKKYFGDNFSILTSENFSKMINSILGILSLFIVGAAAISLIVGAIGISNTMHMAVLERKKEIGILKAIGAENETILAIFTLESGLLGFFGGLIGLILGYILSYIVVIFANQLGYKTLQVWFSPEFCIFILIFSFLVGIISGFIPARQASKLNPVEVLREE